MTGTAQALSTAAGTLLVATHAAQAAAPVAKAALGIVQQAVAYGAGTWMDSFKWILAALASLASPFVLQELTEYIIAVGKVPFWVKPLIPKALSAIVSGVMVWTGVDPTTAAAAGVSLMGLVKLVNESPLALELESKFEAERAKLLVTDKAAPDSSGSATAKAIAMLIFVGAMMVGRAHAGVSFGAISPTASGPRLLEFQPLVTATFYRVGAGAVLQPSIDTLGGITATENWGAYSIGLAAALDKDTSNGNFYLAGGVVAGILPYGMVEAFWKNNGCILGYTMPIGVGASVQ